MMRRCGTSPRLSLEVGFEPRRGGQDALIDAYQLLLPPLSRPVCLSPSACRREEASDAAASNGLDAGTRYGPDPGSDLRQSVFGSAG
jgi:hypothetical protein